MNLIVAVSGVDRVPFQSHWKAAPYRASGG
jgi:hypothetical protein